MSISVFVEHMSSEMNTTSPPDKRVVLIVLRIETRQKDMNDQYQTHN